MSARPLEVGDGAHLEHGTLRWSIARQMRMVASMTTEATGQVPREYVALLAGDDVVLTREQVAGFVPPSRRPAHLEEHPVWLLCGADGLRPTVRSHYELSK